MVKIIKLFFEHIQTTFIRLNIFENKTSKFTEKKLEKVREIEQLLSFVH